MSLLFCVFRRKKINAMENELLSLLRRKFAKERKSLADKVGHEELVTAVYDCFIINLS